jgi:threonine dehydrogenase-like Zn-dependent dehydrogenase
MEVAFRNKDHVILKEMASTEPKVNQIHLRIDACGICGTDIHDNDTTAHRFGHEIAGEILSIGPGVTDLHIGQKVVLDSATPCGRCFMCKNGRQELCTDIQSFYYMDEFGFAEEMNAPAISAIPYDGLDPAVATLQEPLGVAIQRIGHRSGPDRFDGDSLGSDARSKEIVCK